MSNRRLISSDLYEDEFIGSLDIFSRYLWVGLITACADDQGRFLANSNVIRAKIFPFDDYKIADIEAALQLFASAGKLAIYEVRGKRLAQIIAWWKHQAPSWASPSKYSPPTGWIDRHKYHVVGNKVVMLNWDTPGGLPTQLPTQLPTGINESEGEDKSEGDVDVEPPCPPPPEEQPEEQAFNGNPYSTAFVKASNIIPHTLDKWCKAIEAIEKTGALPEDVTAAVMELRDKDYNLAGPWSINNAVIIAKGRRESIKKPKPKFVDNDANYFEVHR